MTGRDGRKSTDATGIFNVTCQRVSISIPRDGAQFGFELLAQFLAFGIGGLARHAHDLADGDFAARERQRNLKAVPAFRADFPVQMIGHRHDGQAGQLRQWT